MISSKHLILMCMSLLISMEQQVKSNFQIKQLILQMGKICEQDTCRDLVYFGTFSCPQGSSASYHQEVHQFSFFLYVLLVQSIKSKVFA